MNILKTFIVSIASVFLSSLALAQTEAGSLDIEDAVAELELSDEQREQMAAIFSEAREERQAIFAEHGIEMKRGEKPDRKAMRQVAPLLRESRKKTDSQIREVLSDSQYETFKELRDEGRKKVMSKFKEKRKES